MDIANKTEQDKIKDQLYEEFLLLQKQLNGSTDQLDHDLAYGKKKLIDSCRHEIVFSIVANVLEADEAGNPTASKEICTKNYHIPVPSDKDYHIYMNVFFNHLENCISNSAKFAKDEQNG
jgi:hypothetical protein